MGAYKTPTADYTRKTNQLAQEHSAATAARQYSQYLGQERFRRGREDSTIGYKRNFPRVGSSFNRRGMWNSGLRKAGQKEFSGDYMRGMGRINWDQGVHDQQYAMQQAEADARYQRALQEAHDEFKMNGVNVDPFKGSRQLY